MRFSPYRIFTYFVVIIAYCVVIYKLVCYNDYATLIYHFTHNLASHWFYLALCVALMLLNILSEAIKWKHAIINIQKISIKSALCATIKGQVGAISTPNKLGDYPTRATTLQSGNRTIGTIMGFVSSWTMTLVIIVVGLFAATIYIAKYHIEPLNNKYLVLTSIICISIILFIFSIPAITKKINTDKINIQKIKNSLLILSQTETKQLLKLTLLSAIRYTIFCSQLLFMLLFFGIDISIQQAAIAIPTIYLLSTITPTIALSEVATRCSYAILVLSPFCDAAPTIAIATSLLWALNNGIPIIAGTLLFSAKNPTKC